MVRLKTLVFHTSFNLLNSMTLGNLPSFASVGAIIESDNSILFIDRSDGLGLSLPGGIVKWGETCEAALKREVREETGYEIIVADLVGVYSGYERDPRFSCVEIVFTGAIVDGKGTSSYEGEIRWIAKIDLSCDLAFDNEQVVSDYLNMETRYIKTYGRGMYA